MDGLFLIRLELISIDHGTQIGWSLAHRFFQRGWCQTPTIWESIPTDHQPTRPTCTLVRIPSSLKRCFLAIRGHSQHVSLQVSFTKWCFLLGTYVTYLDPERPERWVFVMSGSLTQRLRGSIRVAGLLVPRRHSLGKWRDVACGAAAQVWRFPESHLHLGPMNWANSPKLKLHEDILNVALENKTV